jgi:hypothetical protein
MPHRHQRTCTLHVRLAFGVAWCVWCARVQDLLMAIDTVNEVHRFWSRLQQRAAQSGEDEFGLFQRLVTF